MGFGGGVCGVYKDVGVRFGERERGGGGVEVGRLILGWRNRRFWGFFFFSLGGNIWVGAFFFFFFFFYSILIFLFC